MHAGGGILFFCPHYNSVLRWYLVKASPNVFEFPALFLAGILAVAVGCGTSFDPSEIPDLAGSWQYSELAIEPNQVQCSRFGALGFAQEGSFLTGSYSRSKSCATGGALTYEAGSIQSGLVSPDAIKFRIGDCEYQGLLGTTAENGQVLNGTILCTRIVVAGTGGSTSTKAIVWHGTWEGTSLSEPDDGT